MTHEDKKAYNKEYRAKNREKLKSYRKEFYNKNREEIKATSKEWAKNNPNKVRNGHLKREYNITLEQYNLMLVKQNSLCKICKSSEPGKGAWFHVDHNHNTGQIRGLLCHCCNAALGLMKESKMLFQAAIDYLNQAETQ